MQHLFPRLARIGWDYKRVGVPPPFCKSGRHIVLDTLLHPGSQTEITRESTEKQATKPVSSVVTADTGAERVAEAYETGPGLRFSGPARGNFCSVNKRNARTGTRDFKNEDRPLNVIYGSLCRLQDVSVDC